MKWRVQRSVCYCFRSKFPSKQPSKLHTSCDLRVVQCGHAARDSRHYFSQVLLCKTRMHAFQKKKACLPACMHACWRVMGSWPGRSIVLRVSMPLPHWSQRPIYDLTPHCMALPHPHQESRTVPQECAEAQTDRLSLTLERAFSWLGTSI